MKSFIFGANDDSPSTSATQYNFIHSTNVGPVWNNTQTLRATVIPHALTLDQLRVTVDTAPGVGKSFQFTVMKNGTATSLSATITDTATSAQDLSNSVSFAAGDTISMRAVPSGTPTAHVYHWWSIRQDATQMQALIGGGAVNNGVTPVVNYNGLQSTAGADTTESNRYSPMPTAGTLSNLTVLLTTAPGSGKSYDLTLYKNGVATAVTLNIAGTNTTGSDTTHSVSVSAGDTISIGVLANSAPAATNIRYACTFSPTTDGESVLLMGDAAGTNTASANYEQPQGRLSNSWTANENNRRLMVTAVTLKAFYFASGFTPGSGTQYAFTVRKNAANTAATLTVANTATTSNVTGLSVTFADDDMMSMRSDPTSAPSSINFTGGLLLYVAPPAPPAGSNGGFFAFM